MATPTPERIRLALKAVIDPELQQNIVDLGLVYAVQVSAAGAVDVVMTLTTPHCPRADEIVNAVRAAVLAQPVVTAVNVQLVWHPPWTPYRMTPELRAPLGLPAVDPGPPPAAAPPPPTWRTRLQRLRRRWRPS